jgi:glycosyltransferase involved in cell wall biosynthesis
MAIKVLIVINEGKFFLSHRLTLAKAILSAGYEVFVACPDSEVTPQITAAGFNFCPITISRKGINPVTQIKLIYDLVSLYKKIKPDIIHHFTMKPMIFGSIATKWIHHSAAIINAPTGLGYVFTNSSIKAKMLQPIVMILFKYAFSKHSMFAIFQNVDDKNFFEQYGLLKTTAYSIIKGSGIDDSIYIPAPESRALPIVLFPSRFLKDKGIHEFVAAAKQIQEKGIAARFVLVGDIDLNNPATLTVKQIQDWVSQGIVEWWGWQDNIVSVFHQVHIVCLPSYREGIPKVLQEAAACAKPIVTTDAPGCRDVVQEGDNGFLVPVKNSNILASRLITLIQQPDLREKMGKRGRERAQSEFSVNKIINDTLVLYHQCVEKMNSAI